MAETKEKKYSDLESMIEKFLLLDANDDGVVDRSEFLEGCEKQNIDMGKVSDWMARFDVNNDGKVTFEEFCRGLGLKADEMRVEKKHRLQSQSGEGDKPSTDVSMISTTMSLQIQREITEKFKELVEASPKDDSAANNLVMEMKDFMDSKYGRVWQVIVICGSYWIKYSHEPFRSIQFKYGPYICVAWRTPIG